MREVEPEHLREMIERWTAISVVLHKRQYVAYLSVVSRYNSAASDGVAVRPL